MASFMTIWLDCQICATPLTSTFCFKPRLGDRRFLLRASASWATCLLPVAAGESKLWSCSDAVDAVKTLHLMPGTSFWQSISRPCRGSAHQRSLYVYLSGILIIPRADRIPPPFIPYSRTMCGFARSAPSCAIAVIRRVLVF